MNLRTRIERLERAQAVTSLSVAGCLHDTPVVVVTPDGVVYGRESATDHSGIVVRDERPANERRGRVPAFPCVCGKPLVCEAVVVLPGVSESF